MKTLDVDAWMSRNELPKEIKKEILSSIKQPLKQHVDADLHSFLFSILPGKTRTSLKRCLCMKTLKKVMRLQGMYDKVLMSMCDYLKSEQHHFWNGRSTRLHADHYRRDSVELRVE
ncbi:hypothetical protein FF1_002173 [Malus domestica]